MIDTERGLRRRDAAVDYAACAKTRAVALAKDRAFAKELLGANASEEEIDTMVRAIRRPDAVLGALKGKISKRLKRTQPLVGFSAPVAANVQENDETTVQNPVVSKGAAVAADNSRPES